MVKRSVCLLIALSMLSLCACAADRSDGDSAKPAAKPASETEIPAITEPLPPITQAEPPAPTPEPTADVEIEKVNIKYGEHTLDAYQNSPSMHVGDKPLTVTAEIIPQPADGERVTWSSSSPETLSVTENEDGSCTLTVLKSIAGGVLITAECRGVKGECRIYCVE